MNEIDSPKQTVGQSDWDWLNERVSWTVVFVLALFALWFGYIFGRDTAVRDNNVEMKLLQQPLNGR